MTLCLPACDFYCVMLRGFRAELTVEFSNQNLNIETNNFIVWPWCTILRQSTSHQIRTSGHSSGLSNIGERWKERYSPLWLFENWHFTRAPLRRCTVGGNTTRRFYFTARVCRRKTRGRRLSSTARTRCVLRPGLLCLPDSLDGLRSWGDGSACQII